jgi:hypothetical protein
MVDFSAQRVDDLTDLLCSPGFEGGSLAFLSG